MRFGLGWGLGGWWPTIALVNFIYLLLTGTLTMCLMKRTVNAVDNASGSGFKPDSFFGIGELTCAIFEIVTTIIYIFTVDNSTYAIVAAAVNLTGWVSVYAVGLMAMATGWKYNPNLMQRIFHYAMIVMLWAINSLAEQAL